MQLFAPWRHRPCVAHAQTLQIRAAVEFPACFPAEAMAEVKACLFYGGRSCFLSVSSAGLYVSPQHLWDSRLTPLLAPAELNWRRVSWEGSCSWWCFSLEGWTRYQLLYPSVNSIDFICLFGYSSCVPDFSCGGLCWRPRRHVSDAEWIILFDSDINWLLLLRHLWRFSLVCLRSPLFVVPFCN